jgi:hypothetical protein
MERRLASRRIGRNVLAATALVAVALWPSLPPNGPVLMAVVSPAPGATIGLEGIEVLVQFPPEGAAAETFRVLLNGADVTDLLTTGENGCYGQLVGLLPGDNLLRLEVFGRVPWSESQLFEQTREVRVRMRPPQNLDQG